MSGHDFSRADRLFIFLFEPALAGGRRLPNNFFSASSAVPTRQYQERALAPVCRG